MFQEMLCHTQLLYIKNDSRSLLLPHKQLEQHFFKYKVDLYDTNVYNVIVAIKNIYLTNRAV